MTDNNPPTSSLDSSAVRDIHRVMNHRKEAEVLDRGKGIPQLRFVARTSEHHHVLRSAGASAALFIRRNKSWPSVRRTPGTKVNGPRTSC
jgi:hypothetical protein